MRAGRPTEPEQPAGAWNPEHSYLLLMAYFAVLGVLVGATGVVWAGLVDEMEIRSGPFGTAQLGSAVVSTVVVLAYARLAGWRGPRALAIAGAAAVAVSMVAMVAAGSLATLVLALAVMGLGTGLTDGAMTQGSVDWEQATGRRRMNLFHAGFSMGAVAGALGTGSLLALGFDYRFPLLAVAVIHILLMVMTVPVRFPPVETKPRSSRFDDFGDVLSSRAIRSAVAIILLSIIVETGIFIWGVIYIETELGGSALIGGLAYGAFNGAMFAGRLLNASVVDRRGPVVSLALSGIGLIIGGVAMVAAWNAAGGLIAMSLTGFGVAGIYPTVMGAAGERLPGRSGTLASVIMTATYGATIFTPPLLGWVAQFGSLRLSMVAIALSGGGILWLTRWLE